MGKEIEKNGFQRVLSDIPTFFIELGTTIRGTGKTFDTWFKDTPEGLKKNPRPVSEIKGKGESDG